MATIQERVDSQGRKTYRVQVRLKGAPPETMTFPRKTDARKWAQSTEAAIREGRHTPSTEARKRTLGEAVDRYIRDVLPAKRPNTIVSQEAQLKWWKAKIGALPLAGVTPAVIVQARDDLAASRNRQDKKFSPSTVTRYLAILSHLFSVAMREWQWVESNPCMRVTKPKEPRGRVRKLSNEERTKLLSACRESSHPDLYLAVLVALSTGGRRSEILGLRWPDVDLQRGAVTFTDTKNGDIRTVGIAGEALALLKERARIRRIDTDRVFLHTDIRTPWEKAVEAAGVKDFHFHDLRHTCASYLAESGASLAELAAVLGHRSLQMVQRYTHIGRQHTEEVMAKMHAKFLDAESEAGHG
jgi:integrase